MVLSFFSPGSSTTNDARRAAPRSARARPASRAGPSRRRPARRVTGRRPAPRSPRASSGAVGTVDLEHAGRRSLPSRTGRRARSAPAATARRAGRGRRAGRAQRAGVVDGVVAVDQQRRDAVARPRCAARRRRPRRPACRRPAPRGRPGRTTRCTTARTTSVGRAVPVGELGLRRPAARTAPRRRCRARRPAAASDSGWSSPVPDGPPTTGDDQPVERSAGSRSSSAATARSSTSGAFSGWIRPTNSSTAASAASPSRARGRPPRSPGGTASRSTPGWTTVDPGRVGVVQLDQLAWPPRRCWRPAGRRPRRPAPRRSPGRPARGCRPSASAAFLTLAMVCMVCTSGTPQRSRGQPADLAGEPVVGVHEVVVARARGRPRRAARRG